MPIGPTSRVYVSNCGSAFYPKTGKVICITAPVLGLKERMYEVEFDVPIPTIPASLFMAWEISDDVREEIRV